MMKLKKKILKLGKKKKLPIYFKICAYYRKTYEYNFLLWYSKIVQSEQCIYLIQCCDWMFFQVQVQTGTQKFSDGKVCYR